MNIITFTTLYPNSKNPTFAIFVENRLRNLIQSFQVKSIVIAPVPWVPLLGRFVDKYKKFDDLPNKEERHGIVIHHPRFLHLPLIGGWLSPIFIAISVHQTIKKLNNDGFAAQLIDAHYFYPDGVAAVLVSKILKLPCVITARGSDVNLFPQYRLPRIWIKWAIKYVDHIITVSKALQDSLLALGSDKSKMTILRNGVELDLFSPAENKNELRVKYKLKARVLICVGRLEGLKGFDLVIKAMNKIDNTTLLIAGDGPMRKQLEFLAIENDIADRVHFLGTISYKELPQFYSVADALVLASSREGWPNVLLEAMACGTPVVATKVGGTPEIVTCQSAGLLAPSRSVSDLRETICQLLSNPPSRKDTRAFAEQFSWQNTSAGQYKLFSLMVNEK